MDTLSFSQGMALFGLFCLAAYGLWRAVADDAPKMVDRARQIADARAKQRAAWIAAGCWYGPKKDPLTRDGE